MGMSASSIKINFEDMQHCSMHPDQYWLVNTLPDDMQDCLIPNTVVASSEELVLNKLMTSDPKAKIVVYGLNSCDETVFAKYNHLTKCGFSFVSVYSGGMFEWLLLRDIYGVEEFPVTKCELDILKYKPRRVYGNSLIA
jgi:hypothetical protein